MKTTIYSTLPAGHGHRKITIEYRGKLYSAATSDMPTWDAFNSTAFTQKQWAYKNRAEKQLIRFVKSKNNLK